MNSSRLANLPRNATPLASTALALGLLAGLLLGCQAYQVGSSGLYRFDVRTVHVPIFESDSYRRFLGQRLTEAVIKEIELNTPFRIASADQAESILIGRVISDRKRVLVESINDDPRDIQVNLRVEARWTDRSGTPLMERQLLRLNRDIDFVPESGQSLTTAQQELINRIARQIVNQMEVAW